MPSELFQFRNVHSHFSANVVSGTVVSVDGEKEGLSGSTICPITLWDESGNVNMAGDITERELERIHVEVRSSLIISPSSIVII